MPLDAILNADNCSVSHEILYVQQVMASYNKMYKVRVPMPGTVRGGGDPSPRAIPDSRLRGLEDGWLGSGDSRGHAPMNADDEKGHAPTNADDTGHAPDADLNKLEALCPKPRRQVYEQMPNLSPSWWQVQEKKTRRKIAQVQSNPEVDVLDLVEKINKLARGGASRGLIVPDSPICLLCGNGAAVCLGPSCKGRRSPALERVEPPKTSTSVMRNSVPGLVFVDCNQSKAR